MRMSHRHHRQLQFRRSSSDTKSSRNVGGTCTSPTSTGSNHQTDLTPAGADLSTLASSSSFESVPIATVTPDEFLSQYRTKTSECLANAYQTDHPIYCSREGRLTTSLGAELFTLFDMLMSILDEYLTAGSLVNTDAGDAIIVDVMEFLLLNLKYKQTHFRDRCLQDLESCCAASNDFFGMTETAEEVVTRALDRYQLRENRRKAKLMLRKKCRDLTSLYSSDAVYAAQITHMYVFEPICERIEKDLFGREWEENFTQNEVAKSIVRTIEDFFGDIEVFLLNDFIAKKTADALVSATCVFYVRSLLLKARQHNDWLHKKTPAFIDPQRAVMRIKGDIRLMKRFFLGIADRMPALTRVVEQEFSALSALFECLMIGSGLSKAGDIRDFVLVLHKITKNFDVTRNLIGDLYVLVAPKDEHQVKSLVASMKKDLLMTLPDNCSQTHAQPPSRQQVPGLSMEEMLADMYDIHGLGGRLQKYSPKHFIDGFRHGVHTVREKREESDSARDININSKILNSLQDLREKSIRFERRASF